ncbi:MAG TPA: helix-turn-helix domain-containing protein [Pyrinomonadaceae bacterium]
MEAAGIMEDRQHYIIESAEQNETPDKQLPSAIKLEALKELTLTLLKEVESLKHAQPHEGKRSLNLYEEVRRFETEMIRWALIRTGGHQRRAARLLGVKVTTLHAKIKRYRIDPLVLAADQPDMGLENAEDFDR